MESDGPAHERYTSMPQCSQMLHTLSYAVVIVHLQHTDAWAQRPHIDKHQGYLTLGQLIEQRLFDAEGHNRDTLNLALQHAADAMRHPLGIIVCGTDQDLVAIFHRDVFKALNQLREEGIRNLGDDETEQSTSTRHQRSSLSIWKIIEFVDHLPHPFRHLRIHGGDVVHSARYSGNRNICSPCYRANVHSLRNFAFRFGCSSRFLFGHALSLSMRLQHNLDSHAISHPLSYPTLSHFNHSDELVS